MKTKLPNSIKTVKQAETLLTDLYNNKESFHPEDNAHEVGWTTCNPPTKQECDLLNKLMDDIYNIEDYNFDPCEFLLNLDPEYKLNAD